MPPIPPEFHSFEHDGPFPTCQECERPLAELTEPYSITRSWHKGECVFEYAHCLSCRRRLLAEFSEESRQRLTTHMAELLEVSARSARLELSSDRLTDGLATCALCHTPREQLNGYTTGTMAQGDDLMGGPFPLLVCESCEGELQGLISASTRDRWNRFIAENFPGPPNEAPLPQRPTIGAF